MKLYYTKGACSLAVRIIINELEIPCEYESVDLATKKTENSKDFLQINPKGGVPTIELDDGHILTENAVIQQYLADTHSEKKLLPSINDFERYHTLEWLNYVATELHKGFSPLFNSKLPQEIKDELFIPMLQKKFAYVDKHLQQNKYLLGKHFTLPDGYLFVMLLWANKFKLDLSKFANISQYYQHMRERPAIMKSLKEEHLV